MFPRLVDINGHPFASKNVNNLEHLALNDKLHINLDLEGENLFLDLEKSNLLDKKTIIQKSFKSNYGKTETRENSENMFCFFRGSIRRKQNSAVAVSLCDGVVSKN